jgi:hypothetical protein
MTTQLTCYCGQCSSPQFIGAHLAICPIRAQYSLIATTLEALRSQADSAQLEIVKGELQLEIQTFEAEIAALKPAQGYR